MKCKLCGQEYSNQKDDFYCDFCYKVLAGLYTVLVSIRNNPQYLLNFKRTILTNLGYMESQIEIIEECVKWQAQKTNIINPDKVAHKHKSVKSLGINIERMFGEDFVMIPEASDLQDQIKKCCAILCNELEVQKGLSNGETMGKEPE